MAALTTYYASNIVEEDCKGDSAKVDGSGNKLWHGAILMSDGTDSGIRLSGAAAKIMGIIKTTTETDGLIAPVIAKNHFRGMAIAGTPVPGALVYCATDNLADITTTAGGATVVGRITGLNKDGTTWDWVFDRALSAA